VTIAGVAAGAVALELEVRWKGIAVLAAVGRS
jgi:hypothetical protein